MRRFFERLRDVQRREGFTLLEVSVAVTIGLLVAGLAYGAYVFSARVVAGWEQHVRAENELHLFTRRFSQEVRAARGIHQGTERDLTLYHVDGNEVTYQWGEGQLHRDGIPVELTNVAMETGTFTVQQGEERATVVLRFPVRFPKIAVSAAPRDVRIGVATRLPLNWSDATDASFEAGDPSASSFDLEP